MPDRTTLPNTTLLKIRSLRGRVTETGGSDPVAALELAQAINDLDTWLDGGGFLPGAWSPRHGRAVAERTPEFWLR